jgi:hypothetical protein
MRRRRGVEVVRSHRRDIDALRGAAVLLSEFSAPLLHLKVSERSHVIAHLSMTMARLVPLERQVLRVGSPCWPPSGGLVAPPLREREARRLGQKSPLCCWRQIPSQAATGRATGASMNNVTIGFSLISVFPLSLRPRGAHGTLSRRLREQGEAF